MYLILVFLQLAFFSVLEVIPNTMPSHLRNVMRMGRLNITFRDVRNGRLDPGQFPKYRVTYASDAAASNALCEEEKVDI